MGSQNSSSYGSRNVDFDIYHDSQDILDPSNNDLCINVLDIF